MIVYKKGNIFLSEATLIAHGVNCSGGFGSGVAKEIAERYPEVRRAYMDKYQHEGWALGETQGITVNSGWRIIVNCATQFRYGPSDQGPYVDYDAVRLVMQSLSRTWPNNVVSMPKIGAGLAGGSWEIIEQIINEEFKDKEVHVYVLD